MEGAGPKGYSTIDEKIHISYFKSKVSNIADDASITHINN